MKQANHWYNHSQGLQANPIGLQSGGVPITSGMAEEFNEVFTRLVQRCQPQNAPGFCVKDSQKTTTEERCRETSGEGTEIEIQDPMQPMKTDDDHLTVLVIDDDKDIRQFLSRLLSRMGHAVVLARDGREGLEVFEHMAGSVDVVISDITMPEMTGTEFARHQLERHPDIPIILMTGFTTERLSPEFLHSLAGYLRKPIDIRKLKAILGLIERRVHGRT